MAHGVRDVLSRRASVSVFRPVREARDPLRGAGASNRAFDRERPGRARVPPEPVRLALLKTRLATPLEWRRRPPPEVLTAFGDLEAL